METGYDGLHALELFFVSKLAYYIELTKSSLINCSMVILPFAPKVMGSSGGKLEQKTTL